MIQDVPHAIEHGFSTKLHKNKQKIKYTLIDQSYFWKIQRSNQNFEIFKTIIFF